MIPIDLARLAELLAELKRINDAPLYAIAWSYNGKSVDVPDTLIDEYWYVGLSNTHFASHVLLRYAKAAKPVPPYLDAVEDF